MLDGSLPWCAACHLLFQLFVRAGGFDEDLQGLYGYSDIALQFCLDSKHRVRLKTFSYKFGEGLWAAYDAGEGTTGFSRDTSAAYNLWKSKTSQHRWCHDGKWARVPYTEVGSVNW